MRDGISEKPFQRNYSGNYSPPLDFLPGCFSSPGCFFVKRVPSFDKLKLDRRKEPVKEVKGVILFSPPPRLIFIAAEMGKSLFGSGKG